LWVVDGGSSDAAETSAELENLRFRAATSLAPLLTASGFPRCSTG